MATFPKFRWLLVVLILLIAGAVVGVPVFEGRRVAEIERIIAEIPGTLQADKVSVSILNNRVEITGLSGRLDVFPDASMDVSAEALALEGLNMDLKGKAEEVKIADRIHIRNMRLADPEQEGLLIGYSSVAQADTVIDGLWLNPALFVRASAKGERGDAWVRALLSLRYGPTVSTDNVYTVDPRDTLYTGLKKDIADQMGRQGLTMTIGRSQSDAYRLNAFGKILTTDVKFDFTGWSVSMKTAALEGGKTPPELFRIMVLGEEPDPAAGLKALHEGYSLNNLSATEIIVTLTGGQTIEIPAMNMNVELGGGKFDISLKADEIMILPETMRDWSSGFEEFDPVLGTEPLHIYTDFSLNTSSDGSETGTISLDWRHGERRLGDTSLSARLTGQPMTGPGSVIPLNPISLALAEVNFEIRDREFLRRAFVSPSFIRLPVTPDDPAEAARARREQLVQEIRERADHLPDRAASQKGILAAYAAFIAESGTLSVTGRPSEPIPLLGHLGFGGIGPLLNQLNLQAVHTPPESGQ